MCIVYSIPQHRKFLCSGAPSEPILVEATARVMGTIGSISNALLRLVQEGMISRGEHSELVARLLLTLPHDRAANNIRKNPSWRYSTGTTRMHYSLPILLVVGEVHFQTILKSTPQNMPGGFTFEEAFQGARIHFTHIVEARDACVVSDEAAWIVMSRGMTRQCSNQEAIDILIQIIYDDHIRLRCTYSVYYTFSPLMLGNAQLKAFPRHSPRAVTSANLPPPGSKASGTSPLHAQYHWVFLL